VALSFVASPRPDPMLRSVLMYDERPPYSVHKNTA
jgi:hypothetical protein